MKKHAYLIIAHGKFHMLKRLIAALDDERNDIFIHIDKKSGEIDENEFEKCALKSQVTFVSRISVTWGADNIVFSEMLLLKAAFNKGNYQYYHLLSGMDYPIKTQEEIHAFFDKNQGMEFIDYWNRDLKEYQYRVQYYYPLQEKIGRYTYDLKTILLRIQSKLYVFFQWMGKVNRLKTYKGDLKIGSQWVSITNRFCEYLLKNEELIYMLFEKGIAVDELFIQTLCWNSEFRYNIYREGAMRLIDWKRGNPYEWKEEDIDEILKSKCLFLRKVTDKNNLVDIIESRLAGEKNGKN